MEHIYINTQLHTYSTITQQT